MKSSEVRHRSIIQLWLDGGLDYRIKNKSGNKFVYYRKKQKTFLKLRHTQPYFVKTIKIFQCFKFSCGDVFYDVTKVFLE